MKFGRGVLHDHTKKRTSGLSFLFFFGRKFVSKWPKISKKR